MNRRKIFWGIVGPVGVVTLMNIVWSTPDLEKLYMFLESETIIVRSYDPALVPMFDYLTEDLDEKISVNLNLPPKSNKINIYVIDTFKLEKEIENLKSGFKNTLIDTQYVRGNSIAIRPNLILIDSNILRLVIISVMNSLTSIMEHNFLVENGTPPPEALHHHIMSMLREQHHRFLNIRSHLAAQYPIQHLNFLQKEPIQEKEFVMKTFYLGLLPLIGHEIGHLIQSGSLNGPEFGSDEALQELIVGEEERADAVARMLSKQFMKRLKGTDDATKFHFTISLVTVARLFRDQMFNVVFEGFRNLNPEELFTYFEFNSCIESKELVDEDFLSPQKIRHYVHSRLPLFSNKEFQTLPTKLGIHNQIVPSIPHVMRAGRVLAELEMELDIPTEVQEDALRIYFSAFGNKPELLYPDLSDSDTGIDTNKLLEETYSLVEYEASVSCPTELCKIGLIKESKGHLEVMKTPENGRLAHLRLILFLEENDEENWRQFSVLGILLNSLYGNLKGSSASLLPEFFFEIQSCGTGTRWLDSEKFSVLLTTVSAERNIVSMNIIPTSWIETFGGHRYINWPKPLLSIRDKN